MTTQEYIVSKSVLPANGTYTMLEHLQAMLLATYGESFSIEVDVDETIINLVALSEEVIEISESEVLIEIEESDDLTVEYNEITTEIE